MKHLSLKKFALNAVICILFLFMLFTGPFTQIKGIFLFSYAFLWFMARVAFKAYEKSEMIPGYYALFLGTHALLIPFVYLLNYDVGAESSVFFILVCMLLTLPNVIVRLNKPTMIMMGLYLILIPLFMTNYLMLQFVTLAALFMFFLKSLPEKQKPLRASGWASFVLFLFLAAKLTGLGGELPPQAAPLVKEFVEVFVLFSFYFHLMHIHFRVEDDEQLKTPSMLFMATT